MAQSGDRFLQASSTIFRVLAWVTLVLQAVMGLILVIGVGEAVPIGAIELPARVVGLLNLVAAAIYWFLFTFISKITKLLVDVHAHATKACSS